MKLALEVGFGVSLQEFGFETHLLDPVDHLVQAKKEQAECLVVESTVLAAVCSVRLLAEFLESRKKKLIKCTYRQIDVYEMK